MTQHDTLEHRLRTGLHEMADDYDPAPLPRELWERGHAPRPKRVRLELVAAAVVLIALLASVVMLNRPGQLLAPAEAPEGGALPTQVWVPDGHDAATDDVIALRTTGRTSVVALLDDSIALLVSAEDGEHRLRTLPGLDNRLVGSTEASDGNPALALSPDGNRLAWTYRFDDVDDRSAVDTGLHVHNLVTGETVAVKLTSDSGSPIGITALQWSANSEYVAWAGREFQPGEGIMGGTPFRVGVVKSDSGEPQTWEMPTDQFVTVVSVRSDGNLVVADQTTLWDSPGREPGRPLTGAEGRELPDWVDNYENQTGPVSPAGVLAVGAYDESDEYGTVDLDLTADELDRVTRSWDFTDRTAVHPLGWTPDGALLAHGQQMDPEVRRSPMAGDDDELLTQFRGENTVRTLSVASDLGDGSPVDFAPPPWGPEPSPWLLGALLSAALALGLWIVWRLRRPRADAAIPFRSSSGRSGVSSWLTAVALSAVVVGIPLLAVSEAVPWVWLGGIVLLVAVLVLRPRMTVVTQAVFRAVVLAIVLGVATQPWWSSLAPAETSEVAVLPLRAYAPTGLANESFPSNHPTLEEAPTGPVSIAFARDSERIVLVDSHDGSHHLRRLPGLSSLHYVGDAGPALSPDGTRLAWAWETDPDFGDEPLLPDAGSGIAVVDLTTGQMEAVSIDLSRDGSYSFRDLVWSADGSHLGWVGLPQSGRRTANLVVGLTPSEGLTASTLEVDGLPTFEVALAVGDDGRGHLLSGRRLWTLDTTGVQGDRTVSDRRRPWSSAAVSPDGRTLAVGVNGGADPEWGVTGLRTLDLDDPTSRMVLHPWSVPIDGDRVDVLGHTATGRPVVVHGRTSPWIHDSPEREVEIYVLDEEGGEARTRVDGDSQAAVSAATAFAERTPVSFAEPRWPMGAGRQVVIAVVGLALVAQLVQLLRGWRRRRRRVGNPI